MTTEPGGSGAEKCACAEHPSYTAIDCPDFGLRGHLPYDGGSGAGSTGMRPTEVKIPFGMVDWTDERDQLRADLDAARSEIERLTEQRTANLEASDGYLAELHEARRDLARAQSRVDELERVAEAARGMNDSFQHGCFGCARPSPENEFNAWRALNIALAALDAAQATADPEP